MKTQNQEGSDDEALMTRYVLHADRDAFAELFARYSGRLNGLFMRSLGNPDTCQDLVQQTFLQVHRARNDFDLKRPFRPWLYTIALNLRREYFRKRGRRPETQYDPIAHGEPSVDSSATTATERLVRRALAQLPANQRDVIILHWYEQLSFQEIGETVGASLSAVKVRAHRGYKALRVLLQDPSGEGP